MKRNEQKVNIYEILKQRQILEGLVMLSQWCEAYESIEELGEIVKAARVTIEKTLKNYVTPIMKHKIVRLLNKNGIEDAFISDARAEATMVRLDRFGHFVITVQKGGNFWDWLRKVEKKIRMFMRKGDYSEQILINRKI